MQALFTFVQPAQKRMRVVFPFYVKKMLIFALFWNIIIYKIKKGMVQ